MPNIPFVAGKKGYVSIRSGATVWNIPGLVGTGVYVPTNDRLLTAGSAGQAGSGASNVVAGIPTPTLNISTVAMATFFTPEFINALLVTRDANFDLSMLDFRYSNGIDVIYDTGKLRSIRITFDRGSNTIGLDMQFLTRNIAPAAFVTPAYSHPGGLAMMACPAIPYFNDNVIYGSTGESITIDTGASGMKFSGDGVTCTQLSHIAAAATSGVISVDQGAGATARLDAASEGPFRWELGSPMWTLSLGARRMDKGLPLNPMGAADAVTSWALYNVGGIFLFAETP